jgi:hypothetical protein
MYPSLIRIMSDRRHTVHNNGPHTFYEALYADGRLVLRTVDACILNVVIHIFLLHFGTVNLIKDNGLCNNGHFVDLL